MEIQRGLKLSNVEHTAEETQTGPRCSNKDSRFFTVFSETIGTAKVAKSAIEAKELLYFRADDGVTMNRDRVLFDAKQRALLQTRAKQVNAERSLSPAAPRCRASCAVQRRLCKYYIHSMLHCNIVSALVKSKIPGDGRCSLVRI